MHIDAMSPRHMELFVTVMTSKTLQEAAERLRVSQPAVTKAVRLLEREAGLVLFERSHARIRPTPSALRLLPSVQRAIDEIRTAQRMAVHLREESRGHVRIAATDTSLSALLPRAIAKMRQAWADASVEISPEALPARVLELVETRQVDIGISQRPDRKIDPATAAISHPLCEHRLSVVFPKGHAFARLQSLRPSDLAGVPIARVRTQSSTYDLVEAAYRGEQVPIHVFAEANSSFAVCGLVASGSLGVGLVNPLQLAGDLYPGLEFRPFRPKIVIRTCAHVLPTPTLPDTVACLLQCLAEVGAELQRDCG